MTLPLVAASQRVGAVHRDSDSPERRDSLDQPWPLFLLAVGFYDVPRPNHLPTALALLTDLPLPGLLLTGGNDLTPYGGNAPERDATEQNLLNAARARRLPVIGVRRGMQTLQSACHVCLVPVAEHVTPRRTIRSNSGESIVNSYHCFGAWESVPELTIWATAADGVVKAVRHATEPLGGIMWHPERNLQFDEEDLGLFRASFVAQEELAA